MKERESVLSYKKLQQLTGEGIDHLGEFKILIVDDNFADAELITRALHRQSDVKFTSKIVMDRCSYEDALIHFLPDVVYCDFNISIDFNAVNAIKTLKSDHPDVPFILVTGALNEAMASMCFSEGIDDYVLKSNMARLPISLINAIKTRKIELQKKEAYEKLVKSENQVRNFARHINQVLEDERAHIAREIHDELGQQLVGIKIELSSLINNDEKLNTTIKGIMKNVDNTIQSLRKIATELRPGILDSLGLIPSIQWLANEFERKTKMKCSLQLNATEQEIKQNTYLLDKQASTCFFRICQESLTNISKHAEASEVNIYIAQSKYELTLKIFDNGKGIANEKLENPFSMGLLGMYERANIIGAHLNITSEKNIGTTVLLKANIIR